jgi:hypothetical protein
VSDPSERKEADAVFEALWARVLEAWDDDKPHAALLEYALKGQHLPEAAGRYRALKDDPSKAARAQKKLDGIVVAATQLMFATKSAPARTKAPWQITMAAFVFLAFVLVMIAYGVLRRR